MILEIRTGESVRISDSVVVQLLHKSGNHARLRVTAPKDMSIKKQASTPDGVPSMPTFQPS